MNRDTHGQPLPTAVASLLDRHQALEADLAECTALLRQALLEHTPEQAEAGGQAADGWVTGLAGSLRHAGEEGDVVRALIDSVQYLLPGSAGAISLIADAEARAIVAAWRGGRRWSSLSGAIGESDDDGLLESIGREPTEGSVRVVLGGIGLTVGELRLWPGEAGLQGTADQIEAMANIAGQALAGFTLKQRLRQRSVRDALTGLFNHRYLEDTLDREIHRARRNHSSVGVLMIELDDFGALGATHGGDSADRVLEAAAGMLQVSFRGSDICCRYADARFCVVMPDAAPDDAGHRAEALRRQLRELYVRRHGQRIASPTASIGVAAYPAHADSREELLAVAEKALDDARHGGGDVLVAAGQAT